MRRWQSIGFGKANEYSWMKKVSKLEKQLSDFYKSLKPIQKNDDNGLNITVQTVVPAMLMLFFQVSIFINACKLLRLIV